MEEEFSKTGALIDNSCLVQNNVYNLWSNVLSKYF